MSKNLFGFFIVLASVGVLAGSVYFAVNPAEQTRGKEDKQRTEAVKLFLRDLGQYLEAEGVTLLNMEKELPWKQGFEEKTSLRNLLELVSEQRFDSKVDPSLQDELFVTQEETMLWVCFEPSSKIYKARAQDDGRDLSGKRWCEDGCASCVGEELK